MISVITPTNNPRYMTEAYDSLLAQTFTNWEWVVVPNGGAVWGCSDKRLRVIPNDETGSVGALKRFACEQAKGDILVELDHDDMLTPTALEQVVGAFEDSSVGMVYSNNAEFSMPDWGPKRYNEIYGWRYREREFYGHKVQEARAFPPSPLSLCHINFTPNHVRAWRTSDYWRIGGHDASMPLMDDHDISCRFYLQSKLALIDDCLYLYRNHGENTWIARNKEIVPSAWRNADKYRRRLVERWAKTEGLPMLDLGAHFSKPEGYIGVDLYDSDVVADLRDGMPFPDSSVGIVRASDFLEHLPDKEFTMNEIYRVLVPGGWLLSTTPSTDGRGAFQDPTHVSYYNENSFWYYTKAAYAKYAPRVKCRFQARRVRTFFPSEFHRIHNISYVQADLVAIKDGMGRIPGLVEI